MGIPDTRVHLPYEVGERLDEGVLEMTQDPGFGIYVHWPFCQTICPYCDFNVHSATDIDDAAWRDGLLSDLAHYARDTPGRTVTSLYFGGGTPSLIPPQTVGAVIDAIGQRWAVADDIEITLETNPTSAERGRFQGFRAAGVNRLSVGIQSLNDSLLSFLGRDHSGDDGLKALADAQRIFERTTFDLIYALPDQSAEDWQRELTTALEHAGGHVSLYQLTIEPGTAFNKNGIVGADPDTAADMYDLTQDIMDDHGLPAYEVSNHAIPGDESRHNLTGWRGGDYVGIGPGAHGRITINGKAYGTHQIHNPVRWLEKVSSDGHGTAKRRPLSPQDRARELIMMGLRLQEGIDKHTFKSSTGVDVAEVIDLDAKAQLITGQFLTETSTHLNATSAGRLLLNGLLDRLIVD